MVTTAFVTGREALATLGSLNAKDDHSSRIRSGLIPAELVEHPRVKEE